MFRFCKQHSNNEQASGMLGPGADEAFASLAAPEIVQRVRLAHLTEQSRNAIQQKIGLPLGRALLRHWMQGKPGSRRIEAFGLPRHIVDETLGDDGLTLHVDPRKLIRMAVHAPRHMEKRPSSLAFIWDGSWDLRRADLRVGSYYELISELDENRDHLTHTIRFKELMARIESGEPWANHQQGVLLDTPEKICDYLRIYIDFLDDMAAKGFDPTRGKDALGVAISRHGRILKITRGLHRLTMAQRLGLPSIPVRVRCVHRSWWNQVTQGTTGATALQKVRLALPHCVPEESPGPLDEHAEQTLPDDFWPAPRQRPSTQLRDN